MMRHVWTGAATGVALLGTAALVGAQQVPDRGSEPSARERTPDGKGQRPPGAQQRPGTEGPGATEPGKDRSKGVERPDKDRPRTTDQPDKDRPKGAERPDKTRPDMAQPDSKSAPGRAQLSEQQRSEIRTKLQSSGVERTRVQVNVNVGSRLPRSVRLRPLPSAIIALAPAYRGHSYFVRDDDTIVVVDTRSYVVVDVIPAGTRAAGLSLSPDQMRFIYARVPKDRSVDIRVRLGLGAEIPPDVALLPFPPEVLARIPEVEGYRYVVANREVAVVDPKDNSIALVIGE